jgi:NAD(P)-dependent dehydrogenase (short-subunit alcohol dehydrogenase family)
VQKAAAFTPGFFNSRPEPAVRGVTQLRAIMTKLYEVPSQEGRAAIVTGASGGIGLWTAAGLAKAGAHVILICRNAQRGTAAKAFVAQGASRAPDLILADFADLSAVRKAGAEIVGRYPQIHILVNNAGLFSRKRELTKDGYETTFAVNHLAPFLFTNTVLPALERSGTHERHARIVTVASAASNRASLRLDDLMSSRGYRMFGAYSQSKLANILFTKELARRLPPRPVSANCLHPGMVATGIANKGGIEGLVWSAMKPFLIAAEEGAANSLYAAASPNIEGASGQYFVKMRPVSPNPIADDAGLAARLWSESEKLVAAALEARPG